MKKFLIKNKLETGQVIPLVVLMIFVIIGMVALILDGGSIMSNRRTAQAAADAGALAGAQRVCLGKSDAKSVAEYYATVNNNATSALATVTEECVIVEATVENPSFFAKIFGEQTLAASAEATAGCYAASGKAILPMTWRCWPNNNEGPFNEEYGCEMQTLSWELIGPMVDPNWIPSSERVTSVSISDFDGNTEDYFMSNTSIVDSTGLVPPEQIYIISDSDKVCIEEGGDIDCDLDDDGKKDIQLGGNRGLLYLTADTTNIPQWITEPDPDYLIKSHLWLSGKPGVEKDVVIAMVTEGFQGKMVMIPIFNEICDDNPQTDSACVEAAHASPPWPVFDGEDDFSEIRNATLNYHIIAFAPLYISCVSKSGDCPGYRYAQTFSSELSDNESVIEGYFLTDVGVSPDSSRNCDINLGSCTVSLSK